VVNKLFIISTDILTVMFTAVALPSFIQRSSITKKFQLRIYSDIQQQLTILRNVTKPSYIPVVTALVTHNRQTCPSLLMNLQGDHKCCELSAIYLIDLILFSHLQLIRPLYGLFLEIIKAHCSL
jgi:hypothetical protein